MPDAPLMLLGLVIFAASPRLHQRLPRHGERHRDVHLHACDVDPERDSDGGGAQLRGGLRLHPRATTIGKGIVDPGDVTQIVVLAALAGAIFWTSSPALRDPGLLLPRDHRRADRGRGRRAGVQPLQWGGISKILIAIVVSRSRGRSSRSSSWSPSTGVSGLPPSPLNRAFRKLQVFSPPSWPSPTGRTTPRSRWA